MLETAKATRRRLKEDDEGKFPWREIFTGAGCDIGAGTDPLPFPNCRPFDLVDGDANFLSRYFEPESLQYCHASQCLEHLFDPTAVIRDWLTLVKPGGHIICSIPDWVAYEGMTWPSRWNLDHKHSWSLIYRGSIAPKHVYIPDFLAQFDDIAEVRLSRFVDTNYDYKIGTKKDQTYNSADGVECFNEFVLRKRLKPAPASSGDIIEAHAKRSDAVFSKGF